MSDENKKADKIISSGPFPLQASTGLFLVLALIACGIIALGWILHYGKYKTARDNLAFSNQTLSGRVKLLESDLESLKKDTAKTLDRLTETNLSISKTNQTLARDLAGISKSLESATAQNVTLVNEIAKLHLDNRATTAETTKNITELTAAVMKLTDDLNTANNRLDNLVAQLQTKTDEAAELAIRVNTLIEMVARLRVLTGMTTEDTPVTDPNSLSSTPVENPPLMP